MAKSGKVFYTVKDFKNPETHPLYIENYDRKGVNSPAVWNFLINKHGIDKVAFMENVSPKILRKLIYGSHAKFIEVMARIKNLDRIRTKQQEQNESKKQNKQNEATE